MSDIQRIFRGDAGETLFACCQAVKVGNRVFAAGVTGRGPDGKIVAPGDAYQQARQALVNLAATLRQCDASLADVVRTRLYLTRREDIPAVARAHQEAFKEHPPAATLLMVAELLEPAILIEIEADVLIAGEFARPAA